MAVTNRDIEKLRSHLQEWRGGGVSLNAFHDDHDRLILKLVHPSGAKAPVGLALFYCSYLAGPIRWSGSELEPSIWIQSDGVAGLELTDKAAGFTVRCASASLYGEPGITIPRS
jgi:hypothetical protein